MLCCACNRCCQVMQISDSNIFPRSVLSCTIGSILIQSPWSHFGTAHCTGMQLEALLLAIQTEFFRQLFPSVNKQMVGWYQKISSGWHISHPFPEKVLAEVYHPPEVGQCRCRSRHKVIKINQFLWRISCYFNVIPGLHIPTTLSCVIRQRN